MQIAYYLTLTIYVQVLSQYWMIQCHLGPNPEK